MLLVVQNWCGAVYDEEVTSTANATFKEYCQPECDQVKALDVDIAARRVLIRVGGILKVCHMFTRCMVTSSVHASRTLPSVHAHPCTALQRLERKNQ